MDYFSFDGYEEVGFRYDLCFFDFRAIGKLPQLRNLHLDFEKLKKVEKAKFSENLPKTLFEGENSVEEIGITAVPYIFKSLPVGFFANLKVLQELKLSENGIETLPNESCFGKNNSLQTLSYLRRNELRNVPK